MKTDVENNEWKAEAPYLASLQKENPFNVPEQYFNLLPDSINNSIYYEQLKEAIPMPGFSVPDQYFSSLEQRIAAGIKNADDDEGAQDDNLIYSLPKSDGYTTPDLYFDRLHAKILEKTVAQDVPAAKQSSKIIRLWHSGLLKYASAACFVLVSTFGLYINYSHQEATRADIASEQLLYDIDEQDIIDNIQGNNTDVQQNDINKTDLETYILNNYSQSDLSSEQ